MTAWISALGLWTTHPDLFDLMELPAGINREDTIDGILLETAELELLYSDPPFLKRAIGRWSRERLPIWQQLEETLHYDYNPIHNYDRTETRNLNIKRDNNTRSKASGTEDGYRAGYDSGGLVHSEQTTSTTKGSSRGNENVDEGETIRALGNIGVTTTQQMIESQRQVVQFDLERFIIDDFKQAFCLQVY